LLARLNKTALHRTAEPQGLQGWQNALAHGTSREDVAVSIVLSSEHQQRLQSTFDSGVFEPSASDASIARLYYGLLDRAPDASGLAGWENALAQGTSIQQIAQAFISSSEHAKVHGQDSDQQFVQSLYQDALGRPADAGGLASWEAQLSQGASRASVAVGIAESPEAQGHLAANIEVGWKLA
jgi:hypothetical protein